MNNIKLPDLSTADWSILSDYKKEIPQTECQRGIDGGVVVHNEPRVNRKTEDIQLLLEAIPANCSYNEWFRVAAALKNERYSYELFRAWSASSEEKYDEQSCERLWESVGNCEKNIITTGTLKYLAKMHGFNNLQTSCNEIPSELPLPENKEEMILQTTQFIATLFGDNDHF